MTFWVAGAIGGAALIGGIASNDAARRQSHAQTDAANTQLQMFNTINSQEQPFIQGGYGALDQVLYGLNAPGGVAPGGGTGGTGGDPSALTPGQFTKNFTPEDLKSNLSPGYEFQLNTGAQSLQNANSPNVGALSGPALKSLMSFNQGQATTGYQQAFNNFQTNTSNIFARLSGIAGLGQNAASNTGTAGTSLGTGIAQAQAAAGGSQAAGVVGSANALSGSAVPLAYLLSGNNRGGSTNGQSTTSDSGFLG